MSARHSGATTREHREIDPDELRRWFSYDPETGIFRWKRSRARRVVVGSIAGNKTPGGYWTICVHNRAYQAHRVAWTLTRGPIPDGMMIDHINRNKLDNRICNLRVVTNRTNALNNARAPEARGTTFHKRRGKWMAQIQINKRNIILGLFDRQSDARAAYVEALRRFAEGTI